MDSPLNPEQPAGSQTLAAILFEAEALVDRRRHAQARIVVSRGLSAYPDSVQLQYLGAFLDHAEGNADAALAETANILRNAPDHYGARRLRAFLLENAKRLGEAEELWISLLRDYPEDPDCYAGYADLNLSALHLEKAEALAREGLRHDPEHEGCLFVMALAAVAKGRVPSDMDEPALLRLISAHPESRRASIALVIALNDRGDNRAALRIARQLLRAQPDSSDLLEMVKTLRRQSHWSMLPLYPMQRWGWGGAIALTMGGIVLVSQLTPRLPPGYGDALRFVWIGYVVYSWIWPPILRKLLS